MSCGQQVAARSAARLALACQTAATDGQVSDLRGLVGAEPTEPSGGVRSMAAKALALMAMRIMR